jgi:hypothetical protein
MKPTKQTYASHRYNELSFINNSQTTDFLYKLKEQDKLLQCWAKEDEKRPGLIEGKTVRFGVADGYAHYMIVSFTRSTVKLAWLDICDGYAVNTFRVDSKGFTIAPRQVIERTIRVEEGLAKLFGGK